MTNGFRRSVNLVFSCRFPDVDECSTPANRCRYACKNTVGSFLCVCPEGFNQIGKDECRGKQSHLVIGWQRYNFDLIRSRIITQLR